MTGNILQDLDALDALTERRMSLHGAERFKACTCDPGEAHAFYIRHAAEIRELLMWRAAIMRAKAA